MAKYTMELGEIVTSKDINGVLINVFSAYPLFDDLYRDTLETKIIEHFYFQEIGYETIGQFKMRLGVKMREIMPLYNKIYATELLDVRILDNYDIEENYTRDNTNSGSSKNDNTQTQTGGNGNTSTTTNTGEDIDLFSDVAQGRVNFGTNDYVTNITKNIVDNGSTNVNSATNNSNVIDGGTGSNENIGNEVWKRTMKGNIGVQNDSQAIQVYRDSLVNVDLMIIGELNELFMGVF